MANTGESGADALLEVLIAQLLRNGVLNNADIANMQRRLVEGGTPQLAEALAGIWLSDQIDDPGERRAAIHAIDRDGGNEA